jgi:intracellular sulfur oxidation DsrE/DsrF family protein
MRRAAQALAAALIALCVALPAAAPAAEDRVSIPDKPFAEHHLVLQLSDDSATKVDLVISVANNLLKFYGPDRVDIEVVTFGPGVHLLEAANPKRRRVDSLIAQGVRFDVCMNTIETIARRTGKAPALNPQAVPVDVGVARILTLSEKGYTLVRP